MFNHKGHFIKTYFSNLHVNLLQGDYIECDESWVEEEEHLEYNKIYYICEGEGWVKSGKQEFFPKAGDFLIVPSNRVHAYSYINKNMYKKYWCHFNAKIGDRNLFDIIKTPELIHIGQDTHLEKLFKEMLSHYAVEDVTSTMKAKSKLLEIIAYYLDNSQIQEVKMSKSDTVGRLQQLTDYMDKHLNENITIEDLASLVHLQPNYFIKFFRCNLGTTPMQYVKSRRMDKAIRKLLLTKEPISEIAEQIGYQNVSYFSKDFKKYTGQSPTGYRKSKLLDGNHWRGLEKS